MKHGNYKSLSRLIVLAGAGLLALGLAGCNPNNNPNKGPAGGPGGASKDAPSSAPMTPEKQQ